MYSTRRTHGTSKIYSCNIAILLKINGLFHYLMNTPLALQMTINGVQGGIGNMTQGVVI